MEQTQKDPSRELADYVQQSRAAGATDGDIQKQLETTGWSSADIQTVLHPVSVAVSPSKPRNVLKLFVLPLILIIVLLASYVAAAKFSLHTWPFKETQREAATDVLLPSTQPSKLSNTNIATTAPLPEGTRQKIATDPGHSCIFSENFEHTACIEVQDDKKSRYIIDGKPGPWYDDFFYNNGVFSPSGKRFAYEVKKDGKYMVVVDGKEGALYKEIHRINFSADDSTFVYTAYKGPTWVVVVNGTESKEYNEIVSDPVFSPNGKRFVYGVRQLKNYFLIIDGQEKSYSFIPTDITFSPDSSQYVYIAQTVAANSGTPGNLTHTLVLNGQEQDWPVGKSYNIFPTFSPDSKHLAYAAERDGKFFVVTDGKAGPAYDWVIATVFSPDSKRLAYVAGKNNKKFVVVDGVEDPLQFDEVLGVVFSPDSKHVAYRARIGSRNDGKTVVVLDGKKKKIYNLNEMGGGLTGPEPVFSPDSQHLAYIAFTPQGQTRKEFVVVDEVEGKPYDAIEDVTFDQILFTPDGKVIYIAATYPEDLTSNEKPKMFLVIGNREGNPYENIDSRSLQLDPSAHSVSYVAKSGKDYYRVVQGF